MSSRARHASLALGILALLGAPPALGLNALLESANQPHQLPAQASTADIQPTYEDVPYGSHERNVLDFYEAESEVPTPVIIFIHGGGFVAGDKSLVDPAMLRGALDSGISFATINYRFVDGSETTFPAPQHDGARAVQFLRSQAQEWNLDPARVSCYGGSAGAGIAMWIGFHDDLADPTNRDPVRRQSTRIQGVGSFYGQTTYDPIVIKELIGGRAVEHPSLLLIYGLRTHEEALRPSPKMQQLYDESSPITHLSEDDPPLFMVYGGPARPLPPDSEPGEGVHHPYFGKPAKLKMDALGIESVYFLTDETTGDGRAEMLEFFKRHLGPVRRP